MFSCSICTLCQPEKRQMRLCAAIIRIFTCFWRDFLQDSQDSKRRTAGIGQPGQENQDRTAGRMPGQDSQDRSDRAGQLGQDRTVRI
jgi:hypothetical protein